MQKARDLGLLIVARGPSTTGIKRIGHDNGIMGALIAILARTDPAVDPNRHDVGPGQCKPFGIANACCVIDRTAHRHCEVAGVSTNCGLIRPGVRNEV